MKRIDRHLVGDVGGVAAQLLSAAKVTNEDLITDFNGTPMTAFRSDNVDQVIMRWHYERLLIQIANGVVNVRDYADFRYVNPVPAPEIDRKKFTTMSSFDRRLAECERARHGLPPLDDLDGMSSFDKRLVLQARARAEARRA